MDKIQPKRNIISDIFKLLRHIDETFKLLYMYDIKPLFRIKWKTFDWYIIYQQCLSMINYRARHHSWWWRLPWSQWKAMYIVPSLSRRRLEALTRSKDDSRSNPPPNLIPAVCLFSPRSQSYIGLQLNHEQTKEWRVSPNFIPCCLFRA